MRSILIIAFVVVSVFSPIFHIATTTALAAHAQDPKLTNNEMNALQWINNHTSSKDGVLSDPTFLQYVNTFTNARAVLSTDSENSYVVTHQWSHLTDLSLFMNSSTDSATKLLIAKKMDVKYFVYDPVKANYSSDLWKFPLPDFVPDTGIMTEAYKNRDVVVYKIDQSKLSQTRPLYASISDVEVDSNSDSAVVYVTNHDSDPVSLTLRWQDRPPKPVTLNGGETKQVVIDLQKSSGSRFGFMPTLGSTSTLYVSLWMDPPSGNASSTTNAQYAYPVDSVMINSQKLY